MEWPPRSDQMKVFPEVDRAAWFSPSAAVSKLISPQGEFVSRLAVLLANG
jgi:predicted NUDIX family NTP pyrophosphohydrolase